MMNRKTEIKEALWVLCMAVIGLPFLVLLHRSGAIMAAHAATGDAEIFIVFWLLAAVVLPSCVAVFALLKDAEPIDFRVTALLLTCVAPATATILVVVNLLLLDNARG